MLILVGYIKYGFGKTAVHRRNIRDRCL